MAPKLTFNESKAKTLYYEHKTDAEIGQATGVSEGTIASWRYRKKLKSISVINIKPGVKYTEVLTPKQAKEMKLFLQTLLWAGDKAIKAGVKPDITRFIDTYAGRSKTQEEWKEERLWIAKEKARR